MNIEVKVKINPVPSYRPSDRGPMIRDRWIEGLGHRTKSKS